MTLIFVGAVVTIVLTAALLNRQTDLELRKEGRVIIIQQQCDIYMTFIEKVAEIVETARYDAKLIDEMRLSHKLAVVASGGGVPLRAGAGELAIRACRRCALGRGWSKWNDCRR